MALSKVTCPNCSSEISIDDALKHSLLEEVKLESSKELEGEKEKLRKQMEEWQSTQEDKIKEKVREEFGKEIEKSIEDKWVRKLKELEESSIKKANDLESELTKQAQELAESRELELKIRKEKNELEEAKQRFELEKQRQLDGERDKLRQEVAERMLEEHRLRDAEKDKQLDSMRRTIEELQLKANVTSQQLQGEVMEIELEQILQAEFPLDDILPVPKGVNGADILQRVRNAQGQDCGVIVWESKRTKNWTEGWVGKLKDDQRLSKADVAILVTSVMPDGLRNFGPRDGVYITNFESFLGLAKFVRLSLVQLSATKLSVVGKNEKMELIYDYLSGNEFRGRVEAIVEAFSSMKKDLEEEKKAFVRIWAKREKEIDRVINNTVGMHGDLQGLMGQNLARIESLDMASLGGDEEDLPLLKD